MNTQLTNELPVHKALAQAIPQIIQPSYKVGDIIIPGDINKFNKMWQNMDFDKIDPGLFKENQRPTMYRGDNGLHTWANTFSKRRQELTYRSALDIWESSTYYSYLTFEIDKILHTSEPLKNTFTENALTEHEYTKKILHDYLSLAPDTLMFPDNKVIVYANCRLLPIYRDLVSRFQVLGNKTNDERTSIYLNELYSVSNKIQFIQMLSYYGLSMTITKFKILKHNHLANDPEIRDIQCLWETGYKEALYKFYTFCNSRETMSTEIIDKARDLGTIVINHEDNRRLVSWYLLPMMSSIKQDKLKTICCQVVLSYLRTSCITEQYIISRLTFV